MAWFGFWIFLATLVACDTFLFSKGYDSFLWEAKTEHEKALHQKALNEQ
jgi:hypothetical protein